MLSMHLALLDFFESDNDGLYTLFMIAAVGIAVVLIVMVTRQSRAADRARAATLAPPLASETSEPSASETAE
jgi:hypothetical protein